MKIAFIVNEFPSLSQTFVLNQITGLLDRGHDVDIFAEKERGDIKSHEIVKRYNLLERTSYPLVIPRNIVRRFFHSLRYIYKLIKKNPGAILNSLNFFKYGRKAASLILLYQIIPFLEKGPYDIIHCQFGMLGHQALLVKRVAAGTTKLFTSFRGADASQYMQNRPGVYDELFKEGDIFCPVSQSLKKRIIQEGCNEKKIVVVPSSIDCEKFRYSRRRIPKGEPTKILTIGRLVEKKGIRYALEAINY
jgi:colanic acid/amylovoran biosynthesis glycosyltransferase